MNSSPAGAAVRWLEERHFAHHATPIFLAHGTLDPMIPIQYGCLTVRPLTELGYPLDVHEDAMGYEVNGDEVQDVGLWL